MPGMMDTILNLGLNAATFKALARHCLLYTSFLFNANLRENIRLGRPDATDREVEEAAEAAACGFIKALPGGYDTPAGDAGARLSGGERQRIAIARAMLKDSPIVVLDEATAFADPENEAFIQESISRLVKDKTLVVIAHRLSTRCV